MFCCIISRCTPDIAAGTQQMFCGGVVLFEGLCFDDGSKNKIAHALNANSFPHAVIFEGSDENTRLLCAKETAKALVCTGEGKPCGACRACKKAQSGNHPDIYIFQKDEGATAIKVDDVRRLKEKATLLPNDGEKSVFIIAEAQNMNPQAQNALLKIFEEPAAHVCFILTCPSKSALLETVISRACAFMLSQEESALDAGKNPKVVAAATEIIDALCRSESELLFATSALFKDKALFRDVLPFLVLIFRDALVPNEATLSGCGEQANNLRLGFTPKKLLELIEETKLLSQCTERAANHNLSVTRLCSVYSRIKVS